MLKNNITPIIEQIEYCDAFEYFSSLKKYRNAFLLDSACDAKKLGRFSFVGCDPFMLFKSKGDRVQLEYFDGRIINRRANPFKVLREEIERYRLPCSASALPMSSGGAVGYFSYDLKSFVENLPDTCTDDIAIPDCMLGFYDTVLICDNLKKRAYISSVDLHHRLNKSPAARIDELRLKISKHQFGRSRIDRRACGDLIANFSKYGYIDAVKRAKEYIRRGDIYQVNLSQRFETSINIPAFELYRRLRTVSPAPFSAFLDFGDIKILSSSPERFLRTRGNVIETRPIKGTRPRGHDSTSDRSMARALAMSRKDMAEHIMIVDLERNDLGRICEYGSVKPTESSIIEKYANVFHMVSTVAGKLKNEISVVDQLIAAFPGGSITGAPKIRSMEIIDELESTKRSVYTGAIGYLGFDQNMDTSIVIRTIIAKRDRIYFQVGGGIVADSDPLSEYEETLHKARGMMRALGVV